MKAARQSVRVLAVLIGAAGLLPAGGQQQSPPVAVQPKAGRLGELERKAEDRDQMARRCAELEAELARLRDLLGEKPEAASVETNAVVPVLVAVSNAPALPNRSGGESAVVGMIERLRVLQETVRNQEERVRDLESRVAELASSNATLTATNAGLVASNKRLLAGDYEYYEVRKGETLETIAARKHVYGVAARAEWLRQANRNRVQDLENLRPGEVLIVPRYPPSGDFDF